LLLSDDSGQVQGIGMVRIRCENFSVEGNSFVQASCLVKPDCFF
jgi:hypothetical protein